MLKLVILCVRKMNNMYLNSKKGRDKQKFISVALHINDGNENNANLMLII